MSHIARIAQQFEGPVNEEALADCVEIIRTEHQSSQVSTEDDLLVLRNKLKERKGVKA
jgi:predicted house-cleaning noncanonical NTP pyrophosphatase (MazG superfamily)